MRRAKNVRDRGVRADVEMRNSVSSTGSSKLRGQHGQLLIGSIAHVFQNTGSRSLAQQGAEKQRLLEGRVLFVLKEKIPSCPDRSKLRSNVVLALLSLSVRDQVFSSKRK